MGPFSRSAQIDYRQVFGMLQAKDLPQIDIPDHLLPQDLDGAKHYIEKSALLGFCKAQLKMGSAYEVASLHCEFSPLLSIHYNALAARQGEPEAEMALSKWFMIGHEGVCAINHELSYKYAQRAALSGLPAAEFAMGYFHEIGWFVNKDVENAKAWYEKAAKDGSKEAAEGLRRLNNSRALSMHDHNNIAVTRIKSVHGSQRGNRPPRLNQRVGQLPSISDEGGHATPPPPRTASAVPYPTDDRSSHAYAQPQASGRVSMPGHVPPPNSGYGSPAPPNGGFGGPPGQRPVSAQQPSRPGYGSPAPSQYGYGTPPPGAAYNQGPPPGDLRHPQSSTDMGRHYGQPPHPQRLSSMNSIPSVNTPPPQSGAYPPRPPKEPMQMPAPSAYPQPYARPAHATPPPGQASRPPTASSLRPGFDSRPSQPPMTGTPGPQAPGALRPEPSPAGGMRPPSRPSSSQGRPQGRTPPPTSQAQTSAIAPGARPSVQRPQPQSRPSGTGPKTFDQMGVPQAKGDGDCVSAAVPCILLTLIAY